VTMPVVLVPPLTEFAAIDTPAIARGEHQIEHGARSATAAGRDDRGGSGRASSGL